MNKLSEIVDFNPTRPLKKGAVASFIEMASLPTNARYVDRIEQKTFTGSGTKFRNGDVLFARITPCLENGKTAQVFELKDDEIAFGSTEFIVMSAKEPEFDQDYLYYFSQLPEFREYAKSRMEGTSGRQRVSWQSLAEFEFNFPNKQIRKDVGVFLSVFDQKIHLNTQTNQTLEQIAQAIFKSWFVDFDPVKAKINALANGGTLADAERVAMQIISGKTDAELTQMQQTTPAAYKTLEKTAALFPSEMVESELGEVPKGWVIQSIKDFGEIICGKTPTKQKQEYYEGDIPFIKIPDMQGNIFITETNEYLSELGANSQSRKFLPKGSICVSCIATVGKVSIVSKLSQTNQQINSIKPYNKVYSEYLYFYMLSLKETFIALASAGSATLNMNTTTFSNIKILNPQIELINHFKEIIGVKFDCILGNQLEINILSRIRDNLLLKLLSGNLNID